MTVGNEQKRKFRNNNEIVLSASSKSTAKLFRLVSKLGQADPV